MVGLKSERDVREACAAHAGELYGFALRSLGDAGLAEEAVQETFVRAGGRTYLAAVGQGASATTWKPTEEAA